MRKRRAVERAARAAETSTTHSAPLPPSRLCYGCSKRRPVTDFPLQNPLGDAHGERYRVCAPCKVRQQNRRPPRRQTAPPQIGQEDVAGQENIAPRPVRRARQSSAAAERKRTAAVEKALAAALRVTEANARQAEAIARHARVQAEPTMAAVAKAEAVRRVVRATQKASRAMRASQEARRAAVLQESMNAAAAAQAKVEAARLAACDWRLPVYRPRFGPISTVPSRS
ncbi:hypothetical protein E4U38_001830 [Claviceps purpurea]|nr:hypothetical protein E4U38_001830 [Claviceps purpurea]